MSSLTDSPELTRNLAFNSTFCHQLVTNFPGIEASDGLMPDVMTDDLLAVVDRAAGHGKETIVIRDWLPRNVSNSTPVPFQIPTEHCTLV